MIPAVKKRAARRGFAFLFIFIAPPRIIYMRFFSIQKKNGGGGEKKEEKIRTYIRRKKTVTIFRWPYFEKKKWSSNATTLAPHPSHLK